MGFSWKNGLSVDAYGFDFNGTPSAENGYGFGGVLLPTLLKGKQGGSGRDPNRDIPFRGGTGTGANFLNTMGEGWEGVAGGSDWENRGPQLQKSFLQSEFGPGGYLAPAQTSLETASQVRNIYGQGRNGYFQTLNTLGASGLSRRYAAPAAQQARSSMGWQANEALTASMGETNARRFNAMREYVNAASEAAWNQKMAAKNYDIAKKGAGKAESGGILGGAGAAIAGIASAFSDRKLKKNIVPVGIEKGHPVYEFEYKGKLAKEFPGRYRGVMADEVETRTPEAVVTDRHGRKLVRYDLIGPNMSRVA